ncbi:hypothetical protein [Priestia flexa]|uniref:hypothetical protein n=1 Tax=Priestia flexa TaxID=86664 RepID=UPI003CFD3096
MKTTKEQRLQAKANGISEAALYSRLKSGWSIKQAIHIPVNSHHVLSKEDIERAKEYGVHKRMLYARTMELGWDLERAITTPPRYTSASTSRELPETKRLRELAEVNGVPFKLAYGRYYRRGWDLERAATEPRKTANK